MAKIHAYLNFNGNCEEAFKFYQSVFGGEFAHISKFGEMPAQEGSPALSDEEKNRIMHVSLPISSETLLYGSDTHTHDNQFTSGNNFSISINANSEAEADRLFKGLSEGGKITMPLEKTFWNAYFGMWTDKFGINWMVNYDYPVTQ